MKYIGPEIEVIKFTMCDIVTSSLTGGETTEGEGNVVKPPSGAWGE